VEVRLGPFLRSAAQALLARQVPRDRTLQATLDGLWGSTLLVCAAVGLVGAALCYQAGWQARRVLGDQGFIGPEYLKLMVVEFGPLMVGTMLAARGGAGLAARLATRKATLQLETLLLVGDDPVRVLALPEVLAAVVTATVLAPLALLAGEAAGVLTMYLAFSVEPATFLAWETLRVADLWFSLTKTALFGLVVSLAACRAGLRATPDAAGVGQAATRGVVDGSLAVLLLDAVLDAAWLAVGLG
jgi:phospholipid/cholesterol/gamma-HCH transport system permease protein